MFVFCLIISVIFSSLKIIYIFTVYEIVHFEGCHKNASVVVNFVVCINCASLALSELCPCVIIYEFGLRLIYIP